MCVYKLTVSLSLCLITSIRQRGCYRPAHVPTVASQLHLRRWSRRGRQAKGEYAVHLQCGNVESSSTRHQWWIAECPRATGIAHGEMVAHNDAKLTVSAHGNPILGRVTDLTIIVDARPRIDGQGMVRSSGRWVVVDALQTVGMRGEQKGLTVAKVHIVSTIVPLFRGKSTQHSTFGGLDYQQRVPERSALMQHGKERVTVQSDAKTPLQHVTLTRRGQVFGNVVQHGVGQNARTRFKVNGGFWFDPAEPRIVFLRCDWVVMMMGREAVGSYFGLIVLESPRGRAGGCNGGGGGERPFRRLEKG